ncbi:hypothetical protein FPY71_10650 [Aureimonas fodinaquatilis]|uniref:Uncharacterized protein n=1 Tax=Aureimonas fodinaquatilis TaxID=2565783 RepID=A0A5B0DVQ6_9HYPH|nr:hypothetical protein [Aureimonas fodinaquatilis]KAA0970917.1 hypothetical protein FPY71_10650 [Aureimonas fodinaquatilis]
MSDHKPIYPAKVQRQKRLEQVLKDNLKRRKVQSKARKSLMDQTDDGEDAPEGEPQDSPEENG